MRVRGRHLERGVLLQQVRDRLRQLDGRPAREPAAGSDVSGELHDGVIRRPGHGTVIGQSQDDRVATAVDDGIDERHDGDAVPEGATSRLLSSCHAAGVLVEHLGLHPLEGLGTALDGSQLRFELPVRVQVEAHVGSGQGAQRHDVRLVRAVGGRQCRDERRSIGIHPEATVVQARVRETDGVSVAAGGAGDALNEGHGAVAHGHEALARVGRGGLRDDARRVGEIDDEGVRGTLGEPVPRLCHDRHRAQGISEAARPHRLLAGEAKGARERLVEDAGVQAADADLDEDDVRPLERAVERGLRAYGHVIGRGWQAAPTGVRHEVQLAGGATLQHHVQGRAALRPGRPVGDGIHELRRGGAAAAQHRQAHAAAHAAP